MKVNKEETNKLLYIFYNEDIPETIIKPEKPTKGKVIQQSQKCKKLLCELTTVLSASKHKAAVTYYADKIQSETEVLLSLIRLYSS